MRINKFIVTGLIAVLLTTVSCSERREVVFHGSQDHLIMPVLWFQRSAENRALFIQGYNLASMRLQEIVTGYDKEKPPAVMIDLDETVLDNSRYEVWLIDQGMSFTDENWKEWTDRAEAGALPGALEFMKLAETLGVDVFYVSNRDEATATESTLENLKRLGFPFAEKDHLLFKTTTSSKEERRYKIMETHEIVLFMGDNLADHHMVFEKRESGYGFNAVDSMAALFGSRFIVFPNPMYGTWLEPAKLPDTGQGERARMVDALIPW